MGGIRVQRGTFNIYSFKAYCNSRKTSLHLIHYFTTVLS